MEKSYFLTEAPQVGVEEQLASGKSVVAPNTNPSTDNWNFEGSLDFNKLNLTEMNSEVMKLERNKIYAQSELERLGYKFAFICSNRETKELNVQKKVDSIGKTSGLITPCLVVTADVCLGEGLAIVSEDGTEITDTEVSNILVIIDGQHRYKAVKKYNKEVDHTGKEKLECFFHLPLTEGVDIVSMLREANVATVPWKGGDFLINLVTMNHDSDIDMSKIEWVKSNLGSCGDSAAWIWANFKEKIYSKSDMIKASKEPKTLKEMADQGRFEYGKRLYKAVYNKLGKSIVKLKITPLTLVSIYDKETEKQKGDYVVDNLEDFINSITSDEVEKIQKIKKTTDTKGNTVSKDIQIEATLRDLWESYKKRKEAENE